MPIDVRIINGLGSGSVSHVTDRGELIVNDRDYSSPYTASATVINTGYNFTTLQGDGIVPLAGKLFVIKNILISADRNVGTATGALVNIYEADSPTSTTSTKDIIKNLELVRFERTSLMVNMLVSKGKWVNIKTDDNNINATIWGYYIDD